MKGRTLLILLVATGILVGLAAVRFGGGKNTSDVKMGSKLFAELPVNAVAKVVIADAADQVTLVKGDAYWQVQERSGYPADFDRLRDTVVKLSRLKIGRTFAGTPEILTRLSLKAPSAENAAGAGQRITLADASGALLGDVIVGQTRQGEGGGAGGQYLKRADADTVYLVDGDFQFLNAAPAEWLRREILDVKADAITSVTSTTGKDDQVVFRLQRPEKGQAAEMTPILQGRTADPAKIEQVFEALGPLTLADVRAVKADSTPAPGEGTRLVYQLYDGRRMTLFPGLDGDGTPILRITADEVALPTATAQADADVAQAEPGAATDAEPDGDQKDGASAAAAPSAEQLNAQWEPWVFVIKQWQMDSLITEVEPLMEAAASDK
jgi:hypothetical protein